MTQQQVRKPERGTSESASRMPSGKKVDFTEIDELLDEIDEVLDTEEQKEIEKQQFKEKLRSINFNTHRYREALPCSDVIKLPRWVGNLFGMKKYDGPPCVDC